jgi:hypothetical protein
MNQPFCPTAARRIGPPDGCFPRSFGYWIRERLRAKIADILEGIQNYSAASGRVAEAGALVARHRGNGHRTQPEAIRVLDALFFESL